MMPRQLCITESENFGRIEGKFCDVYENIRRRRLAFVDSCKRQRFPPVFKMIERNLNMDKLMKVLHYELKRESKYRPIILYGPVSPQDKNAITPSERDRIVSLLLALNKQFGFHPESFALASNILDRFLYLVKAQKKYLPCIAVACFFLAAKLTEEEEVLPGASELLDASGYSFSVSDLLRMERVILAKLEWDLNTVTPLSFLQAFHALSVVNGCVSQYAVPHHLQLLTHKMELLICRHDFLSYRPSTLALALLIQDLNSSLGQWIDLIQSFQAEIKVPEWELNACCVAVSTFLDITLYEDYLQKDTEVENIVVYEKDLGISQVTDLGGSSSLISALALETKCSFESDEKMSTCHAKVTRMLSTVA